MKDGGESHAAKNRPVSDAREPPSLVGTGLVHFSLSHPESNAIMVESHKVVIGERARLVIEKKVSDVRGVCPGRRVR